MTAEMVILAYVAVQQDPRDNALSPWDGAQSDNKKVNEIQADKLDEWITAVIEIDEDRVYDEETACRMAQDLTTNAPATSNGKHKANDTGENDRATKKPFLSKNAPNSTASSNGSSSSTKHLPQLTETERSLLKDNGGCNRCRKLFIGHETRNCTAEFRRWRNTRRSLLPSLLRPRQSSRKGKARPSQPSCPPSKTTTTVKLRTTAPS
ncbi:hypothetical protein K438DRAFT_1767604 [Mycena galopus ATCC 62051]|nr:hypothetical protein K438DRAFT_1767604 [Mycena galopus ATCC 62051]